MARSKHKDPSWKNVKDWSKGKDRLKVGIVQHPEEDPKTSIIDYMRKSTTKRKELHVLPFEQYEKMGK